MTRYYTAVSDGMLEYLLHSFMPPGLRLTEVVGPSDEPGWSLVELEDDDAPPSMAGCIVTPIINVEGRRLGPSSQTAPYRAWVSDRIVEAGPARTASSTGQAHEVSPSPKEIEQ